MDSHRFNEWWNSRCASKGYSQKEKDLAQKAFIVACQSERNQIIKLIEKAAETCELRGKPHHMSGNPGLLFSDQLVDAIKEMK